MRMLIENRLIDNTEADLCTRLFINLVEPFPLFFLKTSKRKPTSRIHAMYKTRITEPILQKGDAFFRRHIPRVPVRGAGNGILS